MKNIIFKNLDNTKVKILLIIVCMTSFAIACSSSKTYRPLKMDVPTVALAKDMDIDVEQYSAIPLNITTTFSTQDIKVISYITFKNLTSRKKLRWEWYSPNGNLYMSSGNCFAKIKKGKYREMTTAWHRIFIRGERAARHPGKWQVWIYINDEREYTLTFNIF